MIREYNDTSSSKLTLTRADCFGADEFPGVITPSGLSLKRQWYLYNKLREYCHLKTQDLVCPMPATPEQSPPPVVDIPSLVQPTGGQQKTARVCGKCGEAGHNRRTCKADLHP